MTKNQKTIVDLIKQNRKGITHTEIAEKLSLARGLVVGETTELTAREEIQEKIVNGYLTYFPKGVKTPVCDSVRHGGGNQRRLSGLDKAKRPAAAGTPKGAGANAGNTRPVHPDIVTNNPNPPDMGEEAGQG